MINILHQESAVFSVNEVRRWSILVQIRFLLPSQLQWARRHHLVSIIETASDI